MNDNGKAAMVSQRKNPKTVNLNRMVYPAMEKAGQVMLQHSRTMYERNADGSLRKVK
jgi:hypothetical protein